MRPRHRTWLAAAGAGTTTFLAVTVFVIEVLAFEFAAVVGVPVGLLAGLVVHGLLLRYYRELGVRGRRATDAIAGFGYAVLVVAAVTYVDPAGLGSALTFEASAALVVAGGVLAWVTSYVLDRRESTRTDS
jgi:hypothetical protein